jgi:hypothetical protein
VGKYLWMLLSLAGWALESAMRSSHEAAEVFLATVTLLTRLGPH